MGGHGENKKIELRKDEIINLNLFFSFFLRHFKKEDSVFFLSLPALPKPTAKPLCLLLLQARLETRAMERAVPPHASDSHVSTPLINVGHNDGMRTDG
jgi:hypothetical protein